MKRNHTHFLSKIWLSLVLLSVALSACAKPTKSATPAPANDDSGSTANVTITFAGDEWLRSTYEPLMEAFHQQHPNITVQFAPLPQFTADQQDGFLNYERLLATTGDTSITYISGSPSASHYFLDLGPLMEGDPAFDPADFWDGSLEACQDPEGRLLGIPTQIQITGIYYDEKAFSAAGVPAPRPGWTWDDFRAAASAVSAARNGQSRYGYTDQIHNSILIPRIDAMIAQAGGEIDPGQIEQNIQWYLALVKDGAILPPPYTDDPAAWEDLWNKWQELFISPQRPVMWAGQLSESFPGAEWVTDENDPFKNSAINAAGFAPYPVSANNPKEKTSLASTQCLAVSSGSLNPHAAWTWINFLSQQWTGKGSHQMWDLMQIPARKSTVEANHYWDVLPEKAVPTIKFALNHAWYQPGMHVYEVSSVVSALVMAAAGYGELEALLVEAKAQAQERAAQVPDKEPVVVATVQPTFSPDAEVVNYFADTSGEKLAALTELASRYNEDHPDQVIKITSQLDVQGDWFTTLTEQFDCFNWYTLDPTTQQHARLLPLDSFFEDESADFIKDYNPAMLKAFTIEGQLYGLPIATDFPMMAYNKDLLTSKGLKIPANDWTYQDFTNMLAAVGGGEGDQRTYGYQLDAWDESLFDSRGVQWVDLQAHPPVPMLNSQEMVSFAEWLVELKDSGGIYLQTPENYMESDTLMRSGRIAFFRTNASQPKGWYWVNEKPPFEIGVAPFPVFDDPYGGFFIANSRAHMITRDTRNAQACWDWITFLSGQPSIQPGLPARRSVMESSAWEAAVGKENAVAMRAAMQNLRPQPDITNSSYDPISFPLTSWRAEAFRKAMAGEDIKNVLDSAQLKSEAYLDCMQGVQFDLTSEATINRYVEKIRACAREADPEGAMWQSSP